MNDAHFEELKEASWRRRLTPEEAAPAGWHARAHSVGDTFVPGPFGNYRIWMTQATLNYWATRDGKDFQTPTAAINGADSPYTERFDPWNIRATASATAGSFPARPSSAGR